MILKVNPKRPWWKPKNRRYRRNSKRIPMHLEERVDKASDFYKGFHWGNEPKSIRRVSTSKRPKVGMKIGELSSVTYKTRKGGDRNSVYYEHEFGEEGGKLPELVADVDNNKLHIVGGDYKITDAGIQD